jgi:hypothetical protein
MPKKSNKRQCCIESAEESSMQSEEIKKLCLIKGRQFIKEEGTNKSFDWVRYGSMMEGRTPLYCSVCYGDPGVGSYQFAKLRNLSFRELEAHER